MIPLEIAKKLNIHVHTPETMEAIQAYAEWRMEQIKEYLTSETDPRRIAVLQGQYREANQLTQLKAMVEEAAKQARKSAT
jgi:hypothetical protein